MLLSGPLQQRLLAARRTGNSSCAPHGSSTSMPLRFHSTPKLRSTRSQATSADPQQSEAQEMEDATKRWGKQVRDGKVKSLTAKSAGELMKEGWTMLDVRPRHEVETAAIDGAVTVPLFVVDEDMTLGTFIKKATAFGMGGWWEGGTHMKPNKQFISEVQKKIPKDKKVVVACQKGLRSLAASEQLARSGYQTLAWINGGFETAKKGDLQVKGADDVRMASIGGLSSLLGWTEVQQQNSKGFLGGSSTFIRLAVLVIVADALLFFYEQAQYFLSRGQ